MFKEKKQLNTNLTSLNLMLIYYKQGVQNGHIKNNGSFQRTWKYSYKPMKCACTSKKFYT